ncbi:hypothetical protein Plhal703r1_c19g0085321 [Plasmopara halstedii]
MEPILGLGGVDDPLIHHSTHPRAFYAVAVQRGYQSIGGNVTAPQLEKAIAEFKRRIEDGEENVEVVVATRVSVVKRLKSFINRFHSVFIEARYLGDERLADLVITKVQGRAHERAVTEIGSQLRNFAVNTGGILAAGGGDMDMRFPTTGRRVIRRPDSALGPQFSSAGDDPVAPRLFVEVEFSNRSVPKAQTYCRQYFELIPQLNSVLLFKFFGRRVNGTFACVAILYRRAGNRVVVADQVSFGSAPLDTRTLNQLDPFRQRRELPLVPMPVPMLTPWITGNNPFVQIPAADVFDAALTPRTNRPVVAPRGGFPEIFLTFGPFSHS